MHIRHNNLLAQANMLATSTTPKLVGDVTYLLLVCLCTIASELKLTSEQFYLPWKLLPSQEDIIREQMYATEESARDAEDAFRRVREQDEAQLQAMGGGGGEDGGIATLTSNADNDVDPVCDQPDISIHTPPHDDIAEVMDNREFAEEQQRKQPDEHGDNAENNLASRDDGDEAIADARTRRNSDIGDAADIIVDEGGEDTVIY
jgi:hypothetical protein